MSKIKYLTSTAGKFADFDVAKVMYERNQLVKIVSGNPWFTLKEKKIPKNYVKCFGLFTGLNFLLSKQKIFNARKLQKLFCRLAAFSECFLNDFLIFPLILNYNPGFSYCFLISHIDFPSVANQI